MSDWIKLEERDDHSSEVSDKPQPLASSKNDFASKFGVKGVTLPHPHSIWRVSSDN
jgi:hypothetical protein